jgi:predicted TIM-barrel fold metal-dependent hydrolase
VTLPPALAEVLRTQEAHWNEPAALAPMLTREAYAFATFDPAAKTGRDSVASYLGTRFRAAYRIQPIAVTATDTSASIAAYLMRGEGAAAKPFAFFTMTLTREGAAWRIASEMLTPGPKEPTLEDATQLIAALDAAGIKKAVVLSDGYWFDSTRDNAKGPSAEGMRAENDWTAAQVAQYPDRLVAFCSFNPLMDYAIAELDRCAASGKFKGLKLHFGSSEVDLDNPAHVAKVRAVVAEANRLKLPLIVHVRAKPTGYGAKQAQTMLDQIVSAAPDVPFTIAHLWGGEGYSDEALATYGQAVSTHDPHTKNLYFDIAEMALVAGDSPETLKKIAAHMREIGMSRILYGTDGPLDDAGTPADSWRNTVAKVPLTDAEFNQIAENEAPYLR